MMSEDKQEVKEHEIDFFKIAQKLWKKRKLIIKVSIIGGIIGIIIAFSIPKQYTTTVILTSESKKVGIGSMGTLASMAGINLSGMTDSEVFSPELYPKIVNSTLFVQGLLNINVTDPGQNIDTTLYSYIKDNQRTAWWGHIKKIPEVLIGRLSSSVENKESSSNINERFISKEEFDIIDKIKDSYSIDTDKKTGITTFSVTMQSPVISAYLVDTLTSYLQHYIIEERTRKANTDLINTQKLYEQSKTDYYKAQQTLASFMDGNMNVVSARFKTNQEKLQNEVNLTYSVYNQMAQQVQIYKIKVQNETPVFAIIQPAVEPLFPEKPNKTVIVIVCIFLSTIGTCAWILGKNYWYEWKKSLKNQ